MNIIKKIYNLLFGRYKYVKTAFHMGTSGRRSHEEFIKYVNENNIEIINSYVTYHRDELHGHKPDYVHYLIKMKKK